MYNLPVSNVINPAMFNNMVRDKSTSYKLYWIAGIFEEIIMEKRKISFRRIVSRMLSLAWDSAVEYHLDFGYGDQLSCTIDLIRKKLNIKRNINRYNLTNIIENIEDREINKKISNFYNNVPYRFQSAFYDKKSKNGIEGSTFHNAIAKESLENKNYFYKIYKEDKYIEINTDWYNYIIENQAVFSGWIKYNMIIYLQKKNPNVPAIPLKLEIPVKRESLVKAKRFWDIVSVEKPLYDFYTNQDMSIENQNVRGVISIDHFIPWSFVMHNELWNLTPAFKNVNSAKNDSLPVLDKYLKDFCSMQFEAFEIVRKSGKLNRELIDYTHTRIPLYMRSDRDIYEKVDKEYFCNALSETIIPLHQMALNQGYSVWE